MCRRRPHFLVEARQGCAVLLGVPQLAQRDLDRALHVRERAAQLVGSVRGELLHRLERGLEATDHLVEGVDEPADLVRDGTTREPATELGRLDLSRELRDLDDRGERATGEPVADGGGPRDRDRREEEEGDTEIGKWELDVSRPLHDPDHALASGMGPVGPGVDT